MPDLVAVLLILAGLYFGTVAALLDGLHRAGDACPPVPHGPPRAYWHWNRVTQQEEVVRVVVARSPREAVNAVMGWETSFEDEDCGDVFGSQGL